MERKTYHQSQISTYLKCGKLYEFRYIKKYKAMSRPNLTVGSSVDQSVDFSLIKKAHAESTSLDEVQSVASDVFEKLKPDTEWLDEDQGEAKDHVVRLSGLHYEVVVPQIEPATVKEKFVIEMEDGYDLAGEIDLTDKNEFVRDTKTASRQALGFYTIPKTLQPAMYDFAYRAIRGRAPSGFIYDVLKKPTKKIAPEYQAIGGQVKTSDHDWLFETLETVHRAVEAGIALPAAEGSWYCSLNYCPYYRMCKGKE